MAQTPQTFFLRLEPTGQPGIVKATAVEAPPGTWGPDSPIMTPPIHIPSDPPGIWGPPGDWIGNPIVIPPIDEPPTGPDATLVWVFSPPYGRWVQGYQFKSGAGPKDELPPGGPDKPESCEPPAPPRMEFAWVYSPTYNGWIWGYKRKSGAGPK
jgi:hypothetical protein